VFDSVIGTESSSSSSDVPLAVRSSLPPTPTYVAFDLDPETVVSGFKRGISILYGEGSNPAVLTTAGVRNPRAFVLTSEKFEETMKAVERLRVEFPGMLCLNCTYVFILILRMIIYVIFIHTTFI
jgi:hypothetical protein